MKVLLLGNNGESGPKIFLLLTTARRDIALEGLLLKIRKGISLLLFLFYILSKNSRISVAKFDNAYCIQLNIFGLIVKLSVWIVVMNTNTFVPHGFNFTNPKVKAILIDIFYDNMQVITF